MIHPSLKSGLPVVFELFKKYKIKTAYFFGSVLTDHFTQKSDLDILVNFNEDITDIFEKARMLESLQFAIEDNIHRKVDLLEESTLKKTFFIKELNETKQLVYES